PRARAPARGGRAARVWCGRSPSRLCQGRPPATAGRPRPPRFTISPTCNRPSPPPPRTPIRLALRSPPHAGEGGGPPGGLAGDGGVRGRPLPGRGGTHPELRGRESRLRTALAARRLDERAHDQGEPRLTADPCAAAGARAGQDA